MKKMTKILISLLLLVSIVFSFASCEVLEDVLVFMSGLNPFVPKFGRPKTKEDGLHAVDHYYETKWVETYDEMVDILSKMKAAGTKTPQIPAFDCEEYGIDIKFQITLRRSDLMNLEEGQNYYDIKLHDIYIDCYLFFEEITIEQIKARHSILHAPYGSFRLYAVEKKYFDILANPNDYDDLKIHNDRADGTKEIGRYHIYYDGKNQFYIQRSEADFELTEEQIEILKKTVVVIE